MVTTGQFDGKAVCRDGRGLYVGIWGRGVRNPRLNADTVASYEVVELPASAQASTGTFLGVPVHGGNTVVGRLSAARRPVVVVRMTWKDGRTSVLLLEQDDFDLLARDVRPGWESNPRTTD